MGSRDRNVETVLQADISAPLRRRVGLHRAIRLLVGLVIIYVAVAFLILPLVWRRHEERHPALADAATVTHTKSGLPGDPLNVALVGSDEQLHRGMLAAGWYPADPITIESSLRIAVGVVFKRPFDEAPVSPLFLFGRKQDLAFEKPVGDNPRERHHVRFWRSDKLDDQGRPLWWGAATFDTHVGFSHLTGQITHHISPNVDADRDLLMDDLRRAGVLTTVSWIESFQRQKEGRNGEGDPWQSDGRLAIGYITLLVKEHSPSPVP
ncbi:MAG TPA: LssY C-terminal domain-containing protein [Phycisphaerae bacterium]|nr:LssY C-terminal domain-containing protein [Phycisphaerae bacterium]